MDYEISVKVRNNRLLAKMQQIGISTAAELSRESGVSNGLIGNILNMKVGAYGKHGQLLPAVEALCDFFGCLPEDLFPPAALFNGLERNVRTRLVCESEIQNEMLEAQSDVALITESRQEYEILSQTMLALLNDDEKKVIHLRYFEDMTFYEVGKKIGITGERVRHIEAKAFRKIRLTAGKNTKARRPSQADLIEGLADRNHRTSEPLTRAT